LRKILYRLLIGIVILLLLTFRPYFYCYSVSSEYETSSNYLLIAKNLASKNTLEYVAELQNADIESKKWLNFNLNTPNILRPRSYEIDGLLSFAVKKPILYIFSKRFYFLQNVIIDWHTINLSTKLKEKDFFLQTLNKRIIIQRLENSTRVTVEDDIEIFYIAPFFMKNYIDNNIKYYHTKNNKNFINILDSLLLSRIQH